MIPWQVLEEPLARVITLELVGSTRSALVPSKTADSILCHLLHIVEIASQTTKEVRLSSHAIVAGDRILSWSLWALLFHVLNIVW